MWRAPKNLLKALRLEEPPEMRAARKNFIMEHTTMLSMMMIFLVLISVAGGVWLQSIPLALLAVAITVLIAGGVYQAQTSAYYLGKYHGMVAAYAHSPDVEGLVPEGTHFVVENEKPPAETEAGSGEAKTAEDAAQATEEKSQTETEDTK